MLGGSHETVFGADPQAVRVPALVAATQDDRCDVAPPAMAPKIAAAMTRSPDVKVVTVSGGITRSSKDCGSLTPHGYYGIENQVVSLIANWIENHLHCREAAHNGAAMPPSGVGDAQLFEIGDRPRSGRFHPSFFRVCVLEAGMSSPANIASQPK